MDGPENSAPGRPDAGDKPPDGGAAGPFEFDLFISYATDPDYLLARDLHRFLTTFHATPAMRRRALPPLRVCLDSASFLRRRSGRVLSVAQAIESHLQASRELLVLCSPGAARSGFVADEVAWFLEHRGKDAIHIAVTHGAEPAAAPDQVFPPPVLQAGLHHGVWYDLRGLRGWRARRWKGVRDVSRERLRLVAELLGGAGLAPPPTAEALYPDWQDQEHRRRRAARHRWAAAGGLLTVATVVAAIGLWRSTVQGQLAALRDRAGQVAREMVQDPEQAMRHAAQAWRQLQSLSASARLAPMLDDEIAQVRIDVQRALFAALTARPGLAGMLTPPLDDPLVAGSGDGTRFVVAGTRGATHGITLWQADAVPRPLHRLPVAWPERVQCLALDTSGKRLVVAGRRHIGLWQDAVAGASDPAQTIDLAAGEFVDLSCSSAVIRPDGVAAIVGSSDGQLVQIDMATGRMSRLEVPAITGVVNSLIFDPSGRFLYAAAWQAGRPLVRIDLAARPPVAATFESAAAPRGLALDADASTLYVVHEQGEISAHDTTDGRVIARARVGSASLVDLALVADGIVVGDEEGALTLLSPDLKRRGPPVRMARSTITGLVSSNPDGWVAVAGAGDPLRLWRTDAAQPLEQVVARDAGGGLGVRVAADVSRLSVFGGKSVVSWSRDGEAWRAEPTRALAWPEGWMPQAATREGTTLALSAAYAKRDADDRVHLLMPDATIRMLPGFAAKLWRGAFSPSDRWLAVGGLDRPLRVAVWDLRQPHAQPWTFESNEGAGATALAFSRDESMLAIADMRSCVHVVAIGAAPPGPPRSFCDKTDMPGQLDFDPSGAHLVVGSLSGRLRVLRVMPDSLALERVIDGHEKSTTALAFDESGRWLASAASDGSLRFWETGSWQLLGAQRVPGDTFVRDIPALPGGGRFVLLQQGGRRLSVWDVDPERAARRAEALGTPPLTAEAVASGVR